MIHHEFCRLDQKICRLFFILSQTHFLEQYPVDVFGPVFAVFIAVDEAGVGFGLDDEDGVGGNDYVVDFGGVSPVTEEQVVDDFVFAVGQAAKDGGDMFLATAAFWDQLAAERQ